MYHISKDTFEKLPTKIQKMIEDETLDLHESEIKKGQKKKKENDDKMMSEVSKCFDEKHEEEDKDLYKHKDYDREFDKASDKGMAIIIGVGKPKKKEKEV